MNFNKYIMRCVALAAILLVSSQSFAGTNPRAYYVTNNVYHGNLELLNNQDGKWFARVQNLYHELQKQDNTIFFGAIPGKGKPYGFSSSSATGTVCTVVNPSQQIALIELPADERSSKIVYADGGYQPKLSGNKITLGPEQLVVVGFGEFAGDKYNFGTDDTIQIPSTIKKIEAIFASTSKNTIEGKVNPVEGKNVRIVMQQFYKNGDPCRSWPGAPPDGKKVTEVIKIKATQDGKEIPLYTQYDKVIWSGLSWGVAEARVGTFDNAKPLIIQCSSGEKDELTLTADIYAVGYAST